MTKKWTQFSSATPVAGDQAVFIDGPGGSPVEKKCTFTALSTLLGTTLGLSAKLDATDLLSGTLTALDGDLNLSGGSDGQVLTLDSNGDAAWSSVAGTGDVVGPASSTDGMFALFDGTGGKLLQDTTAAAARTLLGYIETSSGAPATTPDFVGQVNLDTAASPPVVYVANGTSDSDDWREQLTEDSGTSLTGKSAPIAADEVVIADSEAGGAFKVSTLAEIITARNIALLASPTFTGVPAVPTAAPGTNTTQAASTAHVFAHAAATATHGVSGALVGTTDAQTLTNKTLTTPTIGSFANAGHTHADGAGGGQLGTTALSNGAVTYAKIQNVTATDRLLGRSTAGAGVVEEIVCTSFIRTLLDDTTASAARTTTGAAAQASPALTGTPTAPTAATTTNTTQIATTAFVQANKVPTINAQTGTTYTFVIGDANNATTMNNAAGNVATIPLNSSVAFPTGTVLNVLMLGAGATGVKGATGVTVNGLSAGTVTIATRYQGASCLKIGTDTWIVSGDVGAAA